MGCQGEISSAGQRKPCLQRPTGMKSSGRFKKTAGGSPWLEPGMQSEVRSYSGREELSCRWTYHARMVAFTSSALGRHSK